ncbi:MAG: trehalose-phosphatase, partial [Thermoleophilaceae bacterium]
MEALQPLLADPARSALLCDIDGVLAPIVRRAEEARVSERVSVLLSRLARSFGLVACVSGRSATDARRLVGVGGIVYAGSHGAELLEPGAARPHTNEAFKGWEGKVRAFVAERDTPELRRLRVRIEDKGPIAAFHWRGVPDEDAARGRLEQLAGEAEGDGLAVHWARKVLEVRPPVEFDKGRAVRSLVESASSRAALFAGDDTTDLDAFDALRQLEDEGALEATVLVGVRSDEG